MTIFICKTCGKSCDTIFNKGTCITSKLCKNCYGRERTKLGKSWSQQHPDEAKINSKKRRLALKKLIMDHYGIICQCCGEPHLEFLVIDHIDGGGCQHIIKLKIRGYRFYQWLKDNKFPEGYQTFCANCNTAKGNNKVQFCPVHHPELYKI